MIRSILTSLAAIALAAPLAAQEVVPDPTDWDAITKAAEGQTVYWHAWGGSNAIVTYAKSCHVSRELFAVLAQESMGNEV